ncbi:MAG: glycosyltransferase [Cyanobacteria bacterium J06621_8]
MMNPSFAPLVSVIIPTYNSGSWLMQALDSVRNQTYINYEIIVVDDGSTDNTSQLVQSSPLAKQQQLKYIYQDNQGVAAARNKGIELATGELIAFLDADDLFLPQKLLQQVAIFAAQPDLGMVVSGWQVENSAGEVLNQVELWHSLPQLDLHTWLYWKPVLPSATMIRRRWLLEVGGFPSETIPVEDVECFLKLVLQGCRAAWCPQIGTVYRQINPESLCRNTLKRVESLNLLHQRFFALPNLPDEIRREENKVNYSNLVWSAWHLYCNSYHREVCDYLRLSLSFTDQSAGEISLNWIESFERYYSEINQPFDTYKLTQTPGWQELIMATLATRQPKVSVMIPAYNSASYLPEAIASVLEQTYTSYEIIVINDGSTDHTSEVIKPFLEQVRYFEQANQGVSATRNRGIYLARGKLVAFLDADDIFLPSKLKRQVAIMEAQPEIGIVNSGFRIITEEGKPLIDTERWQTIPDLTPEIWLLHKPVLPSAMMFRRDWLIKVKGFDVRFFASEDVDLVLRMVAQGCQSTWLREITVYYRQYQTSASWRNPVRQMRNAELMQECFFAREDLPESMRRLERQAKYDFFVWIACVLYQANCLTEMIEYLQKSRQYSPYCWPEMIAQWLNSFENSAKLNAKPFDAYALSNLPQWQELVLSLRISKVLDTYSDEATAYQQLSTRQPTVAETPLYGKAYFELGKKLLGENDLEQALIWLRKAIALEPNKFWYHQTLGTAALKYYDLPTAIVSYRQALRLKPDHEQLQHQLNAALSLQQQWQELVAYCQQLLNEPLTKQPKTDCWRMLMIFPYPPYPPQKGGAAIRMFEQIKSFGKRHHLTVVAFVFDDADQKIARELEEYCDRAFLLKLGTPMEPYQEKRQRQLYNFKTWNMYKALQQFSQVDFDLVCFDFIVSAIYQDLFSNQFTVLNEHNIESKLLKLCASADCDRLIPTLAEELDAAKAFLDAESESALLAEFEDRTWHKFNLRTVVSQENQQELTSRCPQGQTLVVKNGIDVGNIKPVGNHKSQKILFMGTMSYYPNIDGVLYFVKSIFPLIQSQNPQITLCIAGRQPPQIIQDLAQSQTSIEVIADPQDMSQVAAECSLSIVPLRSGSGTRIKILHSMALGLPVVSTSIGCEGLETGDRTHLLIRDTPQDFAQSLLELIGDSQLWQELRTKGRQLVEENYDWTAIFAEYETQLALNIEHFKQTSLI